MFHMYLVHTGMETYLSKSIDIVLYRLVITTTLNLAVTIIISHRELDLFFKSIIS